MKRKFKEICEEHTVTGMCGQKGDLVDYTKTSLKDIHGTLEDIIKYMGYISFDFIDPEEKLVHETWLKRMKELRNIGLAEYYSFGGRDNSEKTYWYLTYKKRYPFGNFNKNINMALIINSLENMKRL